MKPCRYLGANLNAVVIPRVHDGQTTATPKPTFARAMLRTCCPLIKPFRSEQTLRPQKPLGG